ncbi:high affinity cationic amino acid transporter 1-like [Adelges cooleyi]|uniref:high affinity cationic amino acid transporter 1-like n=1 Tax=Adelges cooleyi TaxID=133065 RepID=UPI00217F6D77|nr:high affinity cationic amino acid transporter 1-like [Adelges cooleyi]XP_050433624.1 high affinity cationic amino acid transporter 1-like [Adelges cooleyi]
METPWWKSKKKLTWALTRKKTDEEEQGVDKLKRVLTFVDLTALSTGATLGCGVYVLAGAVAKSIAGPAVVLSFAIAAVVSAFSGLCYAEFAGRVPKAGSAYIYSYVAVGEFTAFVIGWNLLIEHLIGAAAVAKSMSNYVDSLLGSPQQKYMTEHFPIHVSFLASYPDAASFVVIMTITLLVAWGVRESTSTNNIFTILNLSTVTVVIVTGFLKANYSNWAIPKSEIPSNMDGGEGGFLPFGWAGVAAGAAKCFYGFIGFDSIATTGEETKNPKRDIPLAIIASLFISTIAYCGVATVLTLMWPYYDQDENAPLPQLYQNLEMPTVKFIVSTGAIFALCTSLLGCIFPIPRILYSMSDDGLLFKFLSKINSTTKTPLISTLLCGAFSGSLAVFFNLAQLIDMASIGTLQAYTIVSICVLVLRYSDNKPLNEKCIVKSNKNQTHKWFNLSNTKTPNSDTQYVSRALILIFSLASVVFGVSLANVERHHDTSRSTLLTLCYISFFIMVVTTYMLFRLPQAEENLSFKVPFVPIIPCLSVILNVYLMMELDYKTWIRFIVWLLCGLMIYLFYGINHSLEGKKQTKTDENKSNISVQSIVMSCPS